MTPVLLAAAVLLAALALLGWRLAHARRDSARADQHTRTLIRAVEQSPVSIAITDPAGVITYVNPRFCRETGYAAEEAVGQTMRLVQSGGTPPEVYREMWQTITGGQDWRGELLNRRRDGSLLWEEVLISPVLDDAGQIAHFVAVKEDITARRAQGEALSHYNDLLEQEAQQRIGELVHALAAAEAAEAALRDSQVFVQGILDAVDSQIAVLDAQGTIVATNAAWSRFARENAVEPGTVPPHTEVGANYLATCAAAEGEADGVIARQGIEDVLAGRRPRFTLDYPCHAPTEERWFTLTATPLHGARPGAVVAHTNITTRKRQEAAIAELNRTLARRVGEVEAADRAKDAFLANMSHEIRTPLNAILGLAHLAELGARDTDQRDYLKKIGLAGESLLGIVNAVLDLSKIAAGRMELERQPFALSHVLRHLQSVHEHAAKAKDLQLALDVAHDVPAAFTGDALRLGQVLDNLLGNAIKFTDRGEVGLAIRRAGPDDDAGVPLAFIVRDTGIGMSPLEIGRLFDPFTQADASITRRHGGTGLGLAICRQLAGVMGGRLEVESTPGEGTRFTLSVSLPAADPATVSDSIAERRRAAEQIQFSGARVLVVDDQSLNQVVTRDLLERRGLEVDLADNGEQAVACVQAHPPGHYDAVLMDVQMPVLDGIGATRAIRRGRAHAGLPIIAMTAHTLDHERAHYREAGMVDHLGKPFAPSDLIATLARWIPADKQRTIPSQAELLEAPPAASVPDIPGVDVAAALARFNGDPLRYRGWLARFVTESPQAVAGIRSLAGSDPAAAIKAVHAFKGQAGMLGLTALHQATAALETAWREGAAGTMANDTANDMAKDMAGWLATYERTRAELARWLGDHAAPGLPLSIPTEART